VPALLSKGYSREEVVNLFRFVDQMMALPDSLQQEFKTELIRQRELGQMPFVSRIEEMAKEEGLQQGIQQGLQQGIQQGIQEATRRILREETLAILEVRFNAVPPEVAEALNGIDHPDTLRRLLRAAITIPSVAEFQQLISTAL
jgi:flagellar biosynthesis/type III secretory pathway protein FliH